MYVGISACATCVNTTWSVDLKRFSRYPEVKGTFINAIERNDWKKLKCIHYTNKYEKCYTVISNIFL